MHDTPTPDEQRSHLHTLLQQFSTAMLVTHGTEECLRARPMAIARVDADCGVWFITSMDSAKTHEIDADTRVLILCQNDHSAYLALCGRAELKTDRAMISELWQEPFRVWFPGGTDDPTIELIHVHPTQGEFWDNQGVAKIQFMFETAKAYVTGTTPVTKEGEQHGFVRL